MKKTILFCAGILASTFAFSQFVGIEVEQVNNNGLAPGKTYRIYAKMTQPGDIIDAVYADDKNPIEIKTTTKFYQHPMGGFLSSDLQRFDLQNEPKLHYDSFLTIGAIDNYNNYITPFLLDSAEMKVFEQGGNYITLTSAWFATPDRKQTKADKDSRILLMQLTTDGVITGRFNLHGREREFFDEDGNLIDGGFIIEERNVTFTTKK